MFIHHMLVEITKKSALAWGPSDGRL